jgi:NADPH:quinone reductase-like Zn-dependent oxidoreductase
MKAVICTKYGPPEVLKIVDLPKPVPKKNEVLIKIHSTVVTASDVISRGLLLPLGFKIMQQIVLGFGKPRNPVFGMVLSGVVEQSGRNVSRFKIGDEVFAFCIKSAGIMRFGTYAEYKCLPEDWVIAHKPVNMTFDESAAIVYGSVLSWYYFKTSDLKHGDDVLIYGASGSIGTAALQFAKYKGASVTAVCSRKNFELVSSLGADKTIDYTQSGAVSQLEKYNLIFDAVGKAKDSELKQKCRDALKPGGRYLSIDDKSPSQTYKDLLKIKEIIEEGRLKAVIDRTYTLDEIVEAHRYVQKGHKRGSVVIKVV